MKTRLKSKRTYIGPTNYTFSSGKVKRKRTNNHEKFITKKICKYVEFQSSIQLSYCRTNESRVYFSGIIKLISWIIFYKQTMSQSVPKYSWGSSHIKRATTGLVSTLSAVNSVEAAKSKLQRVHQTKKKANDPLNFLNVT